MKNNIVLTDLTIRSLKAPSAGVIDHADAKIAGFGLRVSHTGRKTFYFHYRFGEQRPRISPGRYPEVTLAHARKKAEEARGLLRRGLNPAHHLRVDETISHASEAVTADALPAPAFLHVLEEYVSKYLFTNCRIGTAKETSRNLRATFLHPWAAKPLDEIVSADVTRIIDAKIADGKPGAANHALSNIKTFFKWCVDRKLIKVSPAQGHPEACYACQPRKVSHPRRDPRGLAGHPG